MPTNRYRNENMTMGFPPFTGAVRAIVLFSTAVYVLILFARAFAPAIGDALAENGALLGPAVLHGKVWQLVTYGFVNFDPINFALSMLGVYFLGGAVEAALGSRRFVMFYVLSLAIAGALGTIASISGVVGQGPAFGAGAATNAILMGFYLLNRNESLTIFPFPIQIPSKYIVIGTAVLEMAYLLLSHFALFYLVLLFGLAAGYLGFVLLLGQRSAYRPATTTGIGRGLSDRMYAVAPAKREPLIARVKNGYHRWKRRRMAKKFEVYMRKHDRSVYFDEHGNYKGHELPDDDKPKGEGKGGWVN
jgi:membrane associated rhomboid family serine protease